MSVDNPSSVESKLVELVLGAKGTVIPQKRGSDGNTSVDVENHNMFVEKRKKIIDGILDAFNKAETARATREEPILKTLIALMRIQVIAFNVIIAGTGAFLFWLKDPNNFPLFFDILKYYIGATVVELIGIFAFVVKGTFTSSHTKLMEILLSKDEMK